MFLDSKLIVEQLHGRWRVKDAKLQPLWAEAKATLAGFQRWSATHVPRAQNSTADRLANEALDRVAAGGPARRGPGEADDRRLGRAAGPTIRGPARRLDGRALAGQPAGVRKVRAPQRRVAGNARPPRGEDQCHSDDAGPSGPE